MDTTVTKTSEIPEHHTTYLLTLDHSHYDKHPQELEDVLQQINTFLSAVGIELSADENAVLKVDINQEKFHSVTKRKAGRKKTGTNRMYEEIMAYRETHTAMETAKWLGLTKQTYYRKLKEHRDNNDDGSVEF